MHDLKRTFVTIFALAQFFLISAAFVKPVFAGCEVEIPGFVNYEEQVQVPEGPTPPYPYYNNNYNNGYNNNYNNDCNNNFNNGYNNEYDNGYNNGYNGDPGEQTEPDPAPTQMPVAVGIQSNDPPQDPCAPGNSFFGPYCGWSPGITEYKHDPDNSVSLASAVIDPGNSEVRIGGLPFGLSDTSSLSLIGLSNIFFLTGILFFFMYLLPSILAKDE